MVRTEEWVDIRAAYQRGVSIRQIARETGRARDTITKIIKQEKPPEYKRKSRATKLDPHKAYVDDRLEKCPTITLNKLLREITALGYDGGKTALGDYTRERRTRRKNTSDVRFETGPGEQAQADFAELGYHVIAGVRMKVSLFVMVLGYSRMGYAKVVTDQTGDTLIEAHKAAFAFFGGVPEHVLYDNPKTVVTHRAEGRPIYSEKLLDFAGLYGFKPRVCHPYRPQTKGKVERFIGYIRSDFLEGETFTSLDDMQIRLVAWIDEIANVRVHATTGTRPIDLLMAEELKTPRIVTPKPVNVPIQTVFTGRRPRFTIDQTLKVEVRALEEYAEVCS